MHWGQIKTLLIVSFLILDVYLFVQFLEKKEQADIGILQHQPSSIEEQLNAESIKVKELPEQEYEETFISVKQQMFTEEELDAARGNKAQKSFIFQNHFIASKLDKAIPLRKEASRNDITEIFNEVAYYPEEYSFWNWNEEFNILIFFQNKMDRPVYYNQNGLVLLFLNDQNEITYYVQTMLGDAELLAERKRLIKPIQAVEKLYEENKLFTGDEITRVNIGFHTRVPFESGVQVFAPIWKVNVNHEKDYFVNAIEGFIFSTNEQEFLEEAMTLSIEKMNTQHKDYKLEQMLLDLNKRTDQTTG